MAQIGTQGRYFEEFQVGDEIKSLARTITEADISAFAALSGDYNPLHTDAEFAKDTPFGQRIAHGLLGLSLASGLAARTGFIDGTAKAFTSLSWRFKAPIFIGDTIHLKAVVSRTRSMSSLGGGIVYLDVSVLNQREETVQQGEWSLIISSRPA
ncbi:MAG: MaoC family dehydratase N-terminal domain-containing protein [Chloroflexi bacterium]|nr:MaoC family dehydratase N-terminal domain-containing protein [Chloroflexota bacterium]